MKKWLGRFCVGICFALPMILISFAFTQASPLPAPAAVGDTQCVSCHESSVKAWEVSTHGNAYNDEAFVKVWEQEGKPTECLTCHTTGYDPETNTWHADNITCVACHSEGIEEHPLKPVKLNRSSALCGECHTDTFFQLSTSTHGESGLTCVNCHNPHTNNLKYESATELCASCHGNRVSRFNHSAHHEQGLSCENCHLKSSTALTSDGHKKSNHTFNVSLDTCTECHSYQIHGPADLSSTADTTQESTVDALHAVESTVVQTTPAPGSPVSFAVIAGLTGMAAGMILAPWLERWYRSFSKKGTGE